MAGWAKYPDYKRCESPGRSESESEAQAPAHGGIRGDVIFGNTKASPPSFQLLTAFSEHVDATSEAQCYI